MLSVNNMLNQDNMKQQQPTLKPLVLTISHLLCNEDTSSSTTTNNATTTLPPMKSPSLSPSSSPSPIDGPSFSFHHQHHHKYHHHHQDVITTPPPLSPNHTFSSSSSTSSLSSYHLSSSPFYHHHHQQQQQQQQQQESRPFITQLPTSLSSPSLSNQVRRSSPIVNTNKPKKNKNLVLDNEMMALLEKNKLDDHRNELEMDEEDDEEMDEIDDNSSTITSSTITSSSSNNNSNSKSLKAKRRRANSKQLQILNQVFERTFFPSTQMRAELGRQLGMSPRTVQIWFQNKRQAMRTREKQRLLKLKDE